MSLGARCEEPDSAIMILPEVEVHASGRSQLRRDKDGAVTVTGSDVLRLNRVLGEVDMVAQLRNLASVSSGSDYASGLSIDGADPSQTQYLIDGAPVIFPYRFGGIFSTFNASHMASMRFLRHGASRLAPYLGSSLEFESVRKLSTGYEGNVNVGLISSSATVRYGYRERFGIGVSGRVSYINELYGSLLRGHRSEMNFSFADLNITTLWQPSAGHMLQATLFTSTDRTGYDDLNYSMNTLLHWTNTVVALSWMRTGDSRIKVDTYMSSFSNKLHMSMPQFELHAPNSLRLLGGAMRFSREPGNRWLAEWEAGVRIDGYKSEPQYARLIMKDEFAGYASRSSNPHNQQMLTVTINGSWRSWPLPDLLRADVSVATGIYASQTDGSGAYRRYLFSPRLQLTGFISAGKIDVTLALRQQPLHRVGFSELGLASDFNIGACGSAPVQRSFTAAAIWSTPLLLAGLRAEAGVYYTTVYNQAEYRGQVLEVIDNDYDPLLHLIIANGYNTGVNIGIEREFGVVTGSINYAYGRGRRHQTGQSLEWRSLNSTGHSLKAMLVWHCGHNWLFSSRFTLASGRPFTPVSALYVISGNIAMEYGERNSARLPMYQRLDLSATYTVAKGKRLKHLVNVSLLNATGHRNVEMQYFILNGTDGTYSLRRLYSLYRFMPSISYTIEF